MLLELIENRKGFFSIGNEIGRNVINFGVNMSLSAKIEKRKKKFQFLVKVPAQGLEHTLSAEKFIQLTLLKKMQNIA